jgi:hypothetical protein
VQVGLAAYAAYAVVNGDGLRLRWSAYRLVRPARTETHAENAA